MPAPAVAAAAPAVAAAAPAAAPAASAVAPAIGAAGITAGATLLSGLLSAKVQAEQQRRNAIMEAIQNEATRRQQAYQNFAQQGQNVLAQSVQGFGGALR